MQYTRIIRMNFIVQLDTVTVYVILYQIYNNTTNVSDIIMDREDIKYRNIESYYDILRYSILPNLSLLRIKGNYKLKNKRVIMILDI